MNRLKQLREERELTQTDLANFLQISSPAYSYYENGKRKLSADTAKKLAEFFNVSVDYLLGAETKDKRLLPVLGTVKAGYDYLVEENIIDYIEPSMNITDFENYFGLRVKGDSMSPQFDEGDFLIVHKTEDINNNDVCIVLINGDEATVKKVVKTNEGIELHAFNPYYPVKKFTYKEIVELPIKILGVVVRQIRKWK